MSKTFSGLTIIAASPTTSSKELTLEVITSSAGHSFERRQAEALIERGEQESGSELIDHAQGVEGDEAEETNVLLHAALDDGAPHFRMPMNVVPDDEEPKGVKFGAIGEVPAGDGKGFN